MRETGKQPDYSGDQELLLEHLRNNGPAMLDELKNARRNILCSIDRPDLLLTESERLTGVINWLSDLVEEADPEPLRKPVETVEVLGATALHSGRPEVAPEA